MDIQVPFYLLFFLFLVLWLMIRRNKYKKVGKKFSFVRETFMTFLFAYLMVVFYLTFEPFYFATPDVNPRNVYWEPFKEIMAQYQRLPRLAAYYAIGNILLLLPFGFLAPLLYKRLWAWWKVLAVGFALSLCIESMQFLFTVRSAEVDDLIFNSAGALIGYFFFNMFFKMGKGRELEKWLDIIGRRAS